MHQHRFMFLRGIPFITCVLQYPTLHRFFHKSSSHVKAENIKSKNIKRDSVRWNDRYLLYLFSHHSFHSLSLVTLSVWTVFLQSLRQPFIWTIWRKPRFYSLPWAIWEAQLQENRCVSTLIWTVERRGEIPGWCIFNLKLFTCTYTFFCMYIYKHMQIHVDMHMYKHRKRRDMPRKYFKVL